MSNITPFTKPVGNDVTFENVREASDLMYETRILGKLLSRLGENHSDIENSDLNDLGRLLLRLTEQPSEVIHECFCEMRKALPEDQY